LRRSIFKEDRERGFLQAGKQSSYRLLDGVAIDDEDEQYSANHALFTSGYLKIEDEDCGRGVTLQHVRWKLVASLMFNLMATDEFKANQTDNIC
jgi:hypothetical protein